MQRIANLVDLEKCCKMSIWTQKSASIQKRTSPLKFDDSAEKSEKSSVSNFSTKVSMRPFGSEDPQEMHAQIETGNPQLCVESPHPNAVPF